MMMKSVSLGLTKGAISPFVINQNFVVIIDQAVLEIEWMTFPQEN